MFNYKHYVPVMQVKQGEYRTLAELSDRSSEFTPLLAIPEIPIDYEEEEPKYSPDKHAERVTRFLLDNRGEAKFFICVSDFLYDEGPIDGADFLKLVLDRLNTSQAIPVLDTSRSVDYNCVAAEYAKQHKTGICLRLRGCKFLEEEKLTETVNKFLEKTEIDCELTDLLFDLERIREGTESLIVSSFQLTQQTSVYQLPWRTITIAGSAFPPINEFDRDVQETTSRRMWLIWKQILTRSGESRKPTFGDYNIDSPEYFEFDPRYMSVSPSIKYTLDSDWLVLKGHTTKGENDFPQFYDLSKSVTKHPDFRGATYSWGDSQIAEKAQHVSGDKIGPGSIATWRRAGISHHITFVLDQIASLA